MKLPTILAAGIAAIAALISTTANAAELPEFLQKDANYAGRYVGFGISQTDADVNAELCANRTSTGEPRDNEKCDEKSAGGKLFYGRTINRHYGFEIGLTYHGEVKETDNDFFNDEQHTETNTITGASLYGIAVGTLPLNDRFQLLGKLGAHIYSTAYREEGDSAENANSIDLVYGIGAAFRFSEKNAIRLDYDVYKAEANTGDQNRKIAHNITHTGLSYIRSF